MLETQEGGRNYRGRETMLEPRMVVNPLDAKPLLGVPLEQLVNEVNGCLGDFGLRGYPVVHFDCAIKDLQQDPFPSIFCIK